MKARAVGLPVARAALCAASLACSGPGTSAAPGPGPAAPQPAAVEARPGAPSAEARAAYQAARAAVGRHDAARAARELSRAVELAPEFTEAWYNLGAATSHLALAAAGQGQDAQALQLVRDAVAQKRRAEALIARGVWWIYQGEQREIVKRDLDGALRDADVVLADERSLLAALRLKAGAR